MEILNKLALERQPEPPYCLAWPSVPNMWEKNNSSCLISSNVAEIRTTKFLHNDGKYLFPLIADL